MSELNSPESFVMYDPTTDMVLLVTRWYFSGDNEIETEYGITEFRDLERLEGLEYVGSFE